MNIKIDSIDKILRQLTCKVPVLLRDSYVPKEQHFYTGIVLAVMQLGLGVFLISAAFGSGSLILVVVGGFLRASLSALWGHCDCRPLDCDIIYCSPLLPDINPGRGTASALYRMGKLCCSFEYLNTGVKSIG